ncbi:MAG: hypothetical protein RL291_2117 [Pseudomonadota bacterium]
MTSPHALHNRLIDDIGTLSASDWNRVFGPRAEDHAFFRACQDAVPDGFRFGAKAVFSGDKLIGAVPTFRLRYRMPVRDIVDKPWVDRFGSLPIEVQGIGSPLVDRCPLGIDPSLDQPTFNAAAELLLEPQKPQRAIEVAVVKDVPEALASRLDHVISKLGYAKVPTLPTAHLSLDKTTITDFVESRERQARKYLRRYVNLPEGLSVEQLTAPGEQAQAFYDLYLAQQRASKVDSGIFDGVAPGFMAAVARHKPEDTVFFAYKAQDELIGFSFSYVDQNELTCKYIGVRQPIGRQFGLFNVDFIQLVRVAQERGIKRLNLGQGSYKTKTSFGGTLGKNWLLIRHPQNLPNALVRRIASKLSFESMDPSIAELRAEGIEPK